MAAALRGLQAAQLAHPDHGSVLGPLLVTPLGDRLTAVPISMLWE